MIRLGGQICFPLGKIPIFEEKFLSVLSKEVVTD